MRSLRSHMPGERRKHMYSAPLPSGCMTAWSVHAPWEAAMAGKRAELSQRQSRGTPSGKQRARQLSTPLCARPRASQSSGTVTPSQLPHLTSGGGDGGGTCTSGVTYTSISASAKRHVPGQAVCRTVTQPSDRSVLHRKIEKTYGSGSCEGSWDCVSQRTPRSPAVSPVQTSMVPMKSGFQLSRRLYTATSANGRAAVTWTASQLLPGLVTLVAAMESYEPSAMYAAGNAP